MKSTKQMVAIAFDLNFRHAAEIFSGVSDYVDAAQPDWQLMPLHFGFEARLMELTACGRLAGVIGTFVSDGWIERLSARGVAAVNIFNFSKINSIPNVRPDDEAIGRVAAAHLITQGAKRFVFFGADGVYYTRLRKIGFATALPDPTNLIELCSGPQLRDQIKALRHDDGLLGVFCSSDSSARAWILEARRQHLECGRDMLVVGVDNDASESIFAGIGISSFQQPIREIAYTAAQVLHELLTQGPLCLNLNVQVPAQLIPRESSLASTRARIAQQAATLLRDNLANPRLDMTSIASKVGVSRRILELALKQQLGTSPYQQLCKERLKHARTLLKTTKLPIMQVGSRCGYPEPHHFSAWFKKQAGLAPKAYRKQHTNES